MIKVNMNTLIERATDIAQLGNDLGFTGYSRMLHVGNDSLNIELKISGLMSDSENEFKSELSKLLHNYGLISSNESNIIVGFNNQVSGEMNLFKRIR